MLRNFVFSVSLLAAGGASAASFSHATPSKPDPQQCSRDLASVDRSFAGAMLDLRRGDAPDAKCGAWRRQIDVMRKASDIFARCTVDEARATNLNQMAGSIADFRALIDEAKCPGGAQ